MDINVEEIVKKVVEELQVKKQTNIQASTKTNNNESYREIEFTEEKQVGVDHPVNHNTIEQAQKTTPARIGIGRTGTRMKTKDYLIFRVDHAVAKDAVVKGVSEELLDNLNLPKLHTRAETREEYLMNLENGRFLNDQSREWAEKNLPKNKQVQIIVADGLSSTGIEANIPDLLPTLLQGLEMKKISVGPPIFVKNARVWLQDDVAKITNCDVSIILLGERPGLATAKSISAYMIYRPSKEVFESHRTVIANIHDGGLAPVEAGAYLADIIEDILKYKASGVKLARMQKEED